MVHQVHWISSAGTMHLAAKDGLQTASVTEVESDRLCLMVRPRSGSCHRPVQRLYRIKFNLINCFRRIQALKLIPNAFYSIHISYNLQVVNRYSHHCMDPFHRRLYKSIEKLIFPLTCSRYWMSNDLIILTSRTSKELVRKFDEFLWESDHVRIFQTKI